MADTYAISARDRKRSEIVKVIDEAETRIAYLRTSLVHVDATIALFDAEREEPGLEPRLGRPQSNYFGKGELSRLVIDTMRLHPTAQPIELARLIMEQRGVNLADRTAVYIIRKSVARVMRKVRARG